MLEGSGFHGRSSAVVSGIFCLDGCLPYFFLPLSPDIFVFDPWIVRMGFGPFYRAVSHDLT